MKFLKFLNRNFQKEKNNYGLTFLFGLLGGTYLIKDKLLEKNYAK